MPFVASDLFPMIKPLTVALDLGTYRNDMP